MRTTAFFWPVLFVVFAPACGTSSNNGEGADGGSPNTISGGSSSSGTATSSGSGSGGSGGATASSSGAGSSGSRSGSSGGSGSSSSGGTGSGSGTGSSSGTSSGPKADAGGGEGGPDAGGDGAGATGSSSPSSQYLPTVMGTCPTLQTGMVTISGQTVQIWAGSPSASQHGSLVFYWHNTGGSSSDAAAVSGFGQTQIDAVTSGGGLVASFATSTSQGQDTGGNSTWWTGDFAIADQVVACAVQQLHIDPRRIYSMGVGVGGFQAAFMAFARSGYLAAVASISGGISPYATIGMPIQLEDPSHVPAAMAVHGALGKDVIGGQFDTAVASASYEADTNNNGGFSIDCNTGGGIGSGPPQVCPSIWQFFQDHPFKVKPEPYANALPSGFPAYCQLGPRAADGGAP